MKTLCWAVTSQQRFIAMTSKHHLTSRDDIELRVVVKLCVGLKLLPVENIKTISNTPADRARDTELEIDMLDVSLITLPAI